MAAIVLMMLVLEGLTERTRQHTLIFSDNIPAVSWTGRLVSSKADSGVAARLLRILALRGRMTEAAMPTPDHWLGEKNEPAGTASRSFETFNAGPYKGWPTKADSSFLTLFAHTYVLPPQTGSWQLAALCPKPLSLMISTLLGARLLMPRWMFPPVHGPGGSGQSIVKIMDSPTLSCPPKRTPKDSTSWWLSLPGAVQAYGGVGTRSRPTPSRLLSAISARLLNWADIPIPDTGETAAAQTSTSRLYHGYRATDPASQSQVALPVKVFLDIIDNEGASDDPLEQVIADFVIIAFYFLLRVGNIHVLPATNAPEQCNSGGAMSPSGKCCRAGYIINSTHKLPWKNYSRWIASP
jgi:hypothetical protein